MTLFADLVATSRRVAETASRNAKTAELAACLRKPEPAEIEIGVAYLSGETRQGRSRIGYALLHDARPGASAGTSSRGCCRREISRDDWTVHVRPELVVEVAFNDLQASPRYPGGLALRFARVKHYRRDKSTQDADTIDTVRRIYQRQVPRTG